MICWWGLAAPGSSLKENKYSAQRELNIDGLKGLQHEHLLFCDFQRMSIHPFYLSEAAVLLLQ